MAALWAERPLLDRVVGVGGDTGAAPREVNLPRIGCGERERLSLATTNPSAAGRRTSPRERSSWSASPAHSPPIRPSSRSTRRRPRLTRGRNRRSNAPSIPFSRDAPRQSSAIVRSADRIVGTKVSCERWAPKRSRSHAKAESTGPCTRSPKTERGQTPATPVAINPRWNARCVPENRRSPPAARSCRWGLESTPPALADRLAC